MTLPDEYLDVIVAAAEIVGRSGGREFEIGYQWDDEDPPPGWPPGKPVPTEAAGWFATAQYRGAKLIGEGKHPGAAAEALARRVLGKGAKCAACGLLIHLDDGFDPPEGRCTWRREGKSWRQGCQGGYGGGKHGQVAATPRTRNRAERRRR